MRLKQPPVVELLKFEPVTHHTVKYSPDLSPSDFHFPNLKRDIKGIHLMK